MSETQPTQIQTTRADRRTFEPLGGSHIDSACKEACRLAAEDNDLVLFKFNDVLLTATPTTDWRELSKHFSAECDRLAKEYRESAEGIASAAKRKAEVNQKQDTVERLIYKLPVVLGFGTLDRVIHWLAEFTNPSDDIGVKFNHREVAQTFVAYGYQDNFGVGQKPEWFNSRDRMGRYIIGQAINCLKGGMPPHGITYTFIEKYKAMHVQYAPSEPLASSIPAEGETP